MKIALIISFLFFSEAAFSQVITKVVRVQYALPQKIAELIHGGNEPAIVRADNILKVIVLEGNPNYVASLEQAIRELDVPAAALTFHKSKNVELIVSVIGGSDKAELLSGGQIPEAMVPVIKQLRAVFPYKNYQLLSSMLLRSSEGAKAWNNGVMKSMTNLGSYSQPSGYGIGYDEASVSPEEGKPIIHLRNFLFKTTVPISVAGDANVHQYQISDISIRTDVDLREGQKVVAGKANVDNSDLALFVVLTARLIE